MVKQQIVYSWKQFKIDVEKLARCILDSKIEYSTIYGIPRGGAPLAIDLGKYLNLELVSNPIPKTLIVDDIADSGRTANKYKNYDIAVLHKRLHCIATNIKYFTHQIDNYVLYPWENSNEDSGIDIVTRMLEYIGENPNRAGLINTPMRVVNMWKELFYGYNIKNLPKVTAFENGKDGIIYNNLLIDSGPFYSFCEHHMILFFGTYHFGYIPGTKIVGLSKIGRVVDYFSARMQIAERLVKEIADYLFEQLNPKGLILLMQARHLCKEIRGVKKWDSPAEVIEVRGCFADDTTLEEKFLLRIK